jgi:hypothetical protein
MTERKGIYFDLPEDDYHSDPALGSTDLRRLLTSGPDYWWHSPLNPNPPPERDPSPALEFGKALHKLVLEGSQKFHALYVRRPDDLARLDAKTKAILCPNGETVIGGSDFDRIETSGQLIALNPDLASAFEGGMPEVSIFWEHELEDGFRIRCKGRFDYLRPRALADLKSIRNAFGRAFPEACTRAIVDYRYDVQAAHYLEGRAHVQEFVAGELVHGDHDPAWLERVASAKAFAFVWIFFQAADAPIVWAKSVSPGNPIITNIARRDRLAALETYRRYTREFADGKMWILNEPIGELTIQDMPGWYR